MTVQEAIAGIRSEYNEPEAAFCTDDEICTFLTDAEVQLANYTDCTQAFATSTTVALQADYTRPSDVMDILRVEWNSVELLKKDKEEIDILVGTAYGYTYPSGNPIYYFEWGDVLTLYPTPTTAQTLKIYYAKTPTTITTSSTAFTIPIPFQQYLKDYAISRMYQKEGQADKATLHLKLWNQNLMFAEEQWDERLNKGKFNIVNSRENYIISTPWYYY